MPDLAELIGRVSSAEGPLPAITLWQPYASLIFVAKPWETRKGKLPAKHIGQPIVIHAAAAYAPKWALSDELHELCMDVWGCSYNFTVPRGSVLGVAKFGPCRPTEDVAPELDADALAAGDFSPGRRAWPVLSAIELKRPIPAKGSQGWWRFDRTTLLRAIHSREVGDG